MQTLNLIQNDVELEKWRFFLCDERYVAEDSHDSNYGYYKNHLLQSESSYYLSILKEDQFLSINSLLPLEECALDYEKRLCKAFNMNLNFEDQKNIPSFDLLILGMGLDGHTCSLFPGHRLIELNDRLIAAIDDAPKPPPKRITMTLPIINEAQNCIFLISGEEKLHLFEVKKKQNTISYLFHINYRNLFLNNYIKIIYLLYIY